VPRDAPAGDYALEAEASLAGLGDLKAKGSLKVVAPVRGQIMADQDGFWIMDGEPYFPLGIYHCHTFDWTVAIDETGLRACDMGFNWMQLWEWDWRNHLSLDRQILDEFVKKELTGKEREEAIDALVAENKRHREEMKGVAICYEGFGIWNDCIVERPGEWGTFSFETLERLPREVKLLSEDPDQLVRMWYFADEAGGNFYRALSRGARRVAAFDAVGYPTFNLGNLPAVMAGDVGGNDIYVRYYGGLGSAATFADRVEALRREYRPLHRRPFIVPQAFGQSERQATETPEWVRIETYLSVIHGACGIGFYCWKQTGDWGGSQKQGMGWNPPTAHEVKKLIAEVKTFQAALMSGAAENIKSDDGNVHALLCGDAASGRFLIAANTLELPVETELPVPGLGELKLEPLFGAAEAKRAGGFLGIGRREALALSLPAWGTAVWRVR
ncbi:MAG: hypothetical protein IJ829_06965, partial [Kiritimatiellae bacterium]|nr:hypothetical protein [Kiritimatiellia bacterium]